MFEGVRGSSYKGDISLDDIELKDGPCASSGKIAIIMCQGCHGFDSPVAVIFTLVTNFLQTI